MNCRGIKVLAILLIAVFCQSFVALADERRGLTVDLCGIVTKTNFVEYMKYLDSIGFIAIQDKLNSGGNPEKQGGLREAAWLMWEKDIVFPANDENRADWSPPTNAVVDSLLLEVRASGVLRFDLLKTEMWWPMVRLGYLSHAESQWWHSCVSRLNDLPLLLC